MEKCLNELTHPRYGVSKVYRVRVAGQPSAEVLQRLRRGVHLAEGVAKVAAITVRKHYQQSTDLEVTLNEGRNREIRHAFWPALATRCLLSNASRSDPSNWPTSRPVPPGV